MLALLPSSMLALMLSPQLPRTMPVQPLRAATCSFAEVRAPLARMQIDAEAASFYDEYRRADPATGEQQPISFAEKEKLYLECLDAFYNEGGKQILPDDEYETLKTDLNFEGRCAARAAHPARACPCPSARYPPPERLHSRTAAVARVTPRAGSPALGSVISTLSKDEIRFVLANKRYSMGKPIMSDSEYDTMRKKLKEQGSPVVLHDAASCSIDGICKLDIKEDSAKQRLLYLPGTIGSVILLCEIFFWTLHTDPILSIILAAIPSYCKRRRTPRPAAPLARPRLRPRATRAARPAVCAVGLFASNLTLPPASIPHPPLPTPPPPAVGGVYFTENIFAQKPLVTVGSCPEADCGQVQNYFFGDLFNVMGDGIIPGGKPGDQMEVVCSNPACKVRAARDP